MASDLFMFTPAPGALWAILGTIGLSAAVVAVANRVLGDGAGEGGLDPVEERVLRAFPGAQLMDLDGRLVLAGPQALPGPEEAGLAIFGEEPGAPRIDAVLGFRHEPPRDTSGRFSPDLVRAALAATVRRRAAEGVA